MAPRLLPALLNEAATVPSRAGPAAATADVGAGAPDNLFVLARIRRAAFGLLSRRRGCNPMLVEHREPGWVAPDGPVCPAACLTSSRGREQRCSLDLSPCGGYAQSRAKLVDGPGGEDAGRVRLVKMGIDPSDPHGGLRGKPPCDRKQSPGSNDHDDPHRRQHDVYRSPADTGADDACRQHEPSDREDRTPIRAIDVAIRLDARSWVLAVPVRGRHGEVCHVNQDTVAPGSLQGCRRRSRSPALTRPVFRHQHMAFQLQRCGLACRGSACHPA